MSLFSVLLVPQHSAELIEDIAATPADTPAVATTVATAKESSKKEKDAENVTKFI